ncbi:MAG: hypothetical protein HC815_35700 [Richelia sp. RM1_1_1]|nr:hypothetical protein [Richelia sp. RM1_1_1]
MSNYSRGMEFRVLQRIYPGNGISGFTANCIRGMGFRVFRRNCIRGMGFRVFRRNCSRGMEFPV